MMSDIILRAPEPEDLEIMLAVENDPLLWEHSSENTGPYTRYYAPIAKDHSPQPALFPDPQAPVHEE